MKIVFRVDASIWIGGGHVMRCLALAQALKPAIESVKFACLPQNGDLIQLIQSRGFQVCVLNTPAWIITPENDTDYAAWLQRSQEDDVADFIKVVGHADLVVTDHYAIDAAWQKAIRQAFRCKIIVIDDLVRNHEADLIVDQTLGRSPTAYDGASRVLAGSHYALLAGTFARNHEIALDSAARSGRPKVLVYFGAIDAHNMCLRVLEVLTPIIDAAFTVVLGKAALHYDVIRNWALERDDVEHLEFVNDMAELILKHDFAVGAPGTSSWESACLGLPSVVIPIADNQAENGRKLVAFDAAISVDKGCLDAELVSAVQKLMKNRSDYAASNLAICDGRGAVRVAIEIESLLDQNDTASVGLERATEADIDYVHRLQSAPTTRKYALNSEIPSWPEHKVWMTSKLKVTTDYFYIIRKGQGNTPCGVLRLDRRADGGYTVSIYIDPDYYSQGIGRSALAIIDRVFADCDLHAVVMEANVASQKLFLKAGYERMAKEYFIRKRKIGS